MRNKLIKKAKMINTLSAKLFLLILLLFSLTTIRAQVDSTGVIPRVGASPEVAMLAKFDYAQVSNYNGVPDISIPLYTIQENGMEVPIVLRYNSSGIKVNEEATWVGLGWDLSVGGSITQIPVGQPDQNPLLSTNGKNGIIHLLQTDPVNGVYMYRHEDHTLFSCPVMVPQPPQEDDFNSFSAIAKYKYGAPDNYIFSIPGASGRFVIDPLTNNINTFGNKSNQVLIKGLELDSSSLPYSRDWTITDLNGVQYLFNIADQEVTDNSSQTLPLTGTDIFFSSATWRISSITSSSGKKINFSYTNGQVSSGNFGESVNYLSDNWYSQGNVINKQNQLDITHTKYLNDIETNNQRVEFVLSSSQDERQDMNGDSLQNTAKRLDYINIWDKLNNRKIKSYKLNYDYFNPTSTNPLEYKRLKLVSIQEIGYDSSGTADTIGSYQFAYDETNPLPGKHSYAIDHWGYYNGRNNNTGLLPKLDIDVLLNTLKDAANLPQEAVNDFYTQGDANRGADSLYMQSGILTQITYPTGGSLKLQYQPNIFTNDTILPATELDPNAPSKHNINAYDIHYPGDTHGTSSYLYPDKNGVLNLYDFVFNVTRMLNSSSTLTGADFKNASVSLQRWTYYPTTVQQWTIPDTALQRFSNQITQTGSGNYTFSVPQIVYQGNPTDKYTLFVTLGDQMPNTQCSYPCEAIATVSCDYRDPFNRPSYGAGLRIASQKMYDQNNKLILSKIYSYLNEDGSPSGKLMSPLKYFSFQPKICKFDNWDGNSTGIHQIETDSIAYNFTISSNSNVPLDYNAFGALVGYDRVAVTENDATNKTNGQTVYYYHNTPSQYSIINYIDPVSHKNEPIFVGLPNIPYNDNGLEQKVEYYDSNGNLVKSSYMTYSSIAYTSTTGAFIYDNYIGPDECGLYGLGEGNPFAYYGRWQVCYYPLIGDFYKLASRTDTEYFNSNKLINVFTSTYNQFGQTTQESHVRLSDNGREDKQYQYPLDFPNDPRSALLIQNNQYNLILHQKETKNNNVVTDENNYSFVSTPAGDAKVFSIEHIISPTPYNMLDQVLYDSDDNVIQYLKNSGPMTVLLWGYNYQYPVAKIIGLSYSDVKTALGQDLINRVTQGIPSATDMSTIRSAIAGKNAQIFTYTYAPLIGMTSETNPKGNMIYYEYDSFGRLKDVKDIYGNVIKRYDYHYQGQ